MNDFIDRGTAECEECLMDKPQGEIKPVVVETGNTIDEEINMQVAGSDDLEEYNRRVEEIINNKEVEPRCKECREER